MHYPWPGNVRELANAIERAVVLGIGDEITPEDLPNNVVSGKMGYSGEIDTDLPFHDAVEVYKKHLIQDAMQKVGGNQSRAAEALGLQRTYLARLLKNLGLRE